MLGVSINMFGPQGEIWIFGLLRWPPWSTHHSESAETLNLPTTSALVELEGARLGDALPLPAYSVVNIRN